MIKVSVIIPIYNVEPYIDQCVNSVLHQTLTDGVECILVDDCGTDKSVEIAESIVKSYRGDVQIKFIHHEKNKGISCARNTGIDAAQGEFVFFMDSDDYITTDCLERLWTLAVKYPKAEVIQGVRFSNDEVYDRNSHYCITKYKLPEYSDDVNFVRRESLLNHYSVEVFDALYKTKFLRDNNLKFMEGVIFEDMAWKMDMARKVNAIAFSPKDSYYYRLNTNGIMGNVSPDYMTSIAKISDYELDCISTGNTFKIELYHIIEFMNLWDEKLGECPLNLMKYGKNMIFSQLYQLMYNDNGIYNKVKKILLIQLFRFQMLLRHLFA